MQKIQDFVYRNTLLALLGFTRALSRADVNPPTKWMAFLDSLRASSDMLHFKLSKFDDEVGEEFFEKEEMFEKRVGKQKFYSQKELDRLKNRRKEIDLNHRPRF